MTLFEKSTSMQIIPFPAHYQSVYTHIDISSFSLISCTIKEPLLDGKTYAFAVPNRNYRFSSELSLQNKNDFHSIPFHILHCKTTMVLL